LVVDDDPDITMVISIKLESKGFEVDSLNDQVLALSNFQSEHYDLAIHDIIMPEMDGFELYNQIKKLDSHVMACFLTASDRVYSNSKTTNRYGWHKSNRSKK
jgi:DNA-binding response OmpR family regulator